MCVEQCKGFLSKQICCLFFLVKCRWAYFFFVDKIADLGFAEDVIAVCIYLEGLWAHEWADQWAGIFLFLNSNFHVSFSYSVLGFF